MYLLKLCSMLKGECTCLNHALISSAVKTSVKILPFPGCMHRVSCTVHVCTVLHTSQPVLVCESALDNVWGAHHSTVLEPAISKGARHFQDATDSALPTHTDTHTHTHTNTQNTHTHALRAFSITLPHSTIPNKATSFLYSRSFFILQWTGTHKHKT